jgi:hypothetical protein
LRGAWLRRHVVGLGPHAPDSRRVDGTAGAQKANMSDLHAARGQDVVQDPAQKLHDVKLGGARAGAAGLAGRAGADTVLDETIRRLEMATVQTEGARDGKDVAP